MKFFKTSEYNKKHTAIIMIAKGKRFNFTIHYDESGAFYKYNVHEKGKVGRIFHKLSSAKKYCKLLDE